MTAETVTAARHRRHAETDARGIALFRALAAVPPRGPDHDRIRTTIIELHFRDRRWDIRPPRRVQDLRRRIRWAAEELGRRTGTRPTAGQLAAYLQAPSRT